MKPLIQKLTETFSPSGYETDIREVIRKEIKPFADEIRVDALGNLIARFGKKSAKGKKIMLAAHMDEIGLMATHIDNNGFVRFTGIGGVRPQALTGGRVRFVNGTRGVIGSDRLLDMSKAPSLEQCFIDVGATSKTDCPVKVGVVCGFERPFLDLKKRLVAKSMDDRIACAVLIETMRLLKTSPHELYFVFTTQEEVGVRGATTSAFGIDPDLGLAVDVTGTGDTPKAYRMEVGLGNAGRSARRCMDGQGGGKSQTAVPARGPRRRLHGRTRDPVNARRRPGRMLVYSVPLRSHALRNGGL
jgi:putative aminopeptidase FrvX